MEQEKPIASVQFASILDTISTKKDGSFKLVIETRELDGQDAAALLQYRQREGYTTFTPNAVKNVDVPKVDAEAGQKTKSQRLRNTIHVLWKQRGSKGTFEEFYDSYLETIIELTKQKLE